MPQKDSDSGYICCFCGQSINPLSPDVALLVYRPVLIKYPVVRRDGKLLLVIVTGATGSGSVRINLVGNQANTMDLPGTVSVSPLAITVGSFSLTAMLPVGGGTQSFSVIAPINFATLTNFSISLTGTTSSTAYNGGLYIFNEALANAGVNTFTVFDANGNVLPNASVQAIPEPATWVFIFLGLLTLPLVKRVRKQRA